VIAVAGIANDLDEVIQVREGDEIAFQLLRFHFRGIEQVTRPAQHDFRRCSM